MTLLLDLLHLFAALIFSAFLYPLWIKFVYAFQMGEEIRGDGPSTHLKKRGTPTMGGLVFTVSVATMTFLFNRSRTQTLFPLFVASLAGLFGLIEDFTKVFSDAFFVAESHRLRRLLRRPAKASVRYFGRYVDSLKNFWRTMGSETDKGLQSYQKILFQGLIAGFVAYWTYFKLGWDYIWLPLAGNVTIGVLYPIFIIVIFIVVLNFVAFTDGLDGLAGGLSLFTLCGYWVIAYALGYYSLGRFAAVFIGALIPFLYFNIYPARVLMGNVGSHVLGAVLVMLGIVMHREIALIVLLAVFLVDGVSSPLQSWSVKLTGKRLFRMAPLHHHFELLGWPETKVTMRFWLFGILFTFLGIFISLL
jgi:phospho-N-acetylmuramoyl-pentapeptide-transferase